MTLHEFGQDNKDVILLIHPSLVMWDYFEYVIPLLEDRYHLIVTRFLADRRIKVRGAAIDGGITPYQLPWIVTRFIAIRDYLMIMMGKVGGIKVLEKAFSTDEYSEEDLKYVEKVLNFIRPFRNSAARPSLPAAERWRSNPSEKSMILTKVIIPIVIPLRWMA